MVEAGSLMKCKQCLDAQLNTIEHMLGNSINMEEGPLIGVDMLG